MPNKSENKTVTRPETASKPKETGKILPDQIRRGDFVFSAEMPTLNEDFIKLCIDVEYDHHGKKVTFMRITGETQETRTEYISIKNTHIQRDVDEETMEVFRQHLVEHHNEATLKSRRLSVAIGVCDRMILKGERLKKISNAMTGNAVEACDAVDEEL